MREWAASDVRGLEEVVSDEFQEERTLTASAIMEYHISVINISVLSQMRKGQTDLQLERLR